MRPCSVSIAMPTCTDRETWMPPSLHDATSRGDGPRTRRRERRHEHRAVATRRALGGTRPARCNRRSGTSSPVGSTATSVSRRAISRRTAVIGSTTTTSSVEPPVAIRSSAVIRPSARAGDGRRGRSPRSFASLRTAGVAVLFADGAGASTGAAEPGLASSATANVTSGEPTGTASPTAPCSDAPRRPANGDGISTVAFAVSTSTSGWFSSTCVALGDQPRDDLALLQALAEVGHGEHALGHQYSTVRRTASRDALDARAGSAARSRPGGYGTSHPVTRATGASRWSNASSITRAAISAPIPSVSGASCTTTDAAGLARAPAEQRERRAVTASGGRRPGTSMPSPASAPAASRQRATMAPYVTTVQASPLAEHPRLADPRAVDGQLAVLLRPVPAFGSRKITGSGSAIARRSRR